MEKEEDSVSTITKEEKGLTVLFTVQTSNPERHRLLRPTSGGLVNKTIASCEIMLAVRDFFKRNQFLYKLIKSITMKKLLFIALLMATTISAQTKLGFSTGVLEQSSKFGLGIASTISVHQDVVDNFGVIALYNYSVLRGTDFQELSLRAYREAELGGRLSIKPNVGIARQISGPEYLTFGLDILVDASDRTQVVLGWQSTARGSWNDPDTGWSLATTIGLIYKL